MPIRKLIKYVLITASILSACPIGASELLDPTRPATKAREKSPMQYSVGVRHWILESTLVAPDRRVAVINGKLVSEGEVVDGARILEIRKLDVLIKTPQERMTLQLLPDNVKKQP
jgi:hypothetical protein